MYETLGSRLRGILFHLNRKYSLLEEGQGLSGGV